MFSKWIASVLNRLFAHEDIGRFGDLLMSRWFLRGKPRVTGPRTYLHCFWRSDPDHCHDHPWPYTTVIMWPGYYEQDLTGKLTWRGPFTMLRRSADWAHRVVLHDSRPCWTLFFPGAKCRQWGFHCPGGWRSQKEYDSFERAGLGGCDPEP